jgi:hypothetical protein
VPHYTYSPPARILSSIVNAEIFLWLDAISKVQNTLDFQGLTPSHPLALVTDAACIKSVTHGA